MRSQGNSWGRLQAAGLLNHPTSLGREPLGGAWGLRWVEQEQAGAKFPLWVQKEGPEYHHRRRSGSRERGGSGPS